MQKLCLGCMKPAAHTEVCPHCGYAEGTPAREPYHLRPGTMLGKYLIGRVLGYGGFGVTYLAYDTQLEIKTAVKEYLPAELATRIPGAMPVSVFSGERAEKFNEGKRKFLDEARRLAQFASEPGIVSIIDVFEANGTSYIVMEYLEGETLKQKLLREGRLSAQETVAIMAPVLDALSKVHQLGIIHRDIAPDNIFLTSDGKVKLLDFGAARYVGTNQSKSLSVILKPGYAPEEQYRSHGTQGPWSDVYACAATMYRMLTGEVPENALERVQKDELKKPSRCGAAVSRQLDTAIMNALAVKQENRTQSAWEFRQQLLEAVSSEKQTAPKHVRTAGTVPVTEAVRGSEMTRATEPYMQPEKPEPKNQPFALFRSKPVIIAAVCLIIGVAFCIGFTVKHFSNQASRADTTLSGDVKVPSVVGMTVEEATKLMEKNGLSAQVTGRVYNDNVDAGQIISQSVEAGKTVPAGSVIALTVCAGAPVTYLLPNLVGKKLADYETELREHFDLKIEKMESSYPEGVICFQSQMPGEYDKYIQLRLQVSEGMDDYNTNITVPLKNYVGMEFKNVQAELSNLKIVLIVKEELSSDEEKGRIIRQNPDTGEYKEGTEVEIVIGKGMYVVRDYTAQRGAEVKAMLEKEGIHVMIAESPKPEFANGLVYNQDIPAGSKLKKDDQITLYVAKNEQREVQQSVTVRDYTGRNYKEVEEELLAAAAANHIAINIQYYYVEDNTHPVNTIIWQSIPAGGQLNDGDTLELRYAIPEEAPPEEPTAEIPAIPAETEPPVEVPAETEPPAEVPAETEAAIRIIDRDGPDYYS